MTTPRKPIAKGPSSNQSKIRRRPNITINSKLRDIDNDSKTFGNSPVVDRRTLQKQQALKFLELERQQKLQEEQMRIKAEQEKAEKEKRAAYYNRLPSLAEKQKARILLNTTFDTPDKDNKGPSLAEQDKTLAEKTRPLAKRRGYTKRYSFHTVNLEKVAAKRPEKEPNNLKRDTKINNPK